MNIAYRKSTNNPRSYMVLETDFDITALDEAETLCTTHVNALLPFYVAELSEDEYQIWYDIWGKTSIKDYLPEHPSETDKILERLKAAITEITTDFNIPEDYLMITPDTIYVDDAGRIYLTYYPQIKSTAIISRERFLHFIKEYSNITPAPKANPQTATEIIKKVKAEICDRFCKYIDSAISDEDFEAVKEKHCDNDCPLNRL